MLLTGRESLRVGNLVGAVMLCLLSSCGEDRAALLPPDGTKAVRVEAAVRAIALVSNVPPKLGETHSDPRARAIVTWGREAVPYLVDQLTNAAPSLAVDLFPLAVGDLAHRFLCEIYGEDFLWPLQGSQPPTGHGLWRRDYHDFVEDEGGRKRLQTMWVERLRTTERDTRKTSSKATD